MMAALPSVVATFFASTATLTQAQIDWLLKRNGVPVAALGFDGDGAGLCIGTACVERIGRRFGFLEDGVGAFIVVARDEDGVPADLVAWAPKDGWVAPWLGTIAMRGQHDLLAPRGPDPLPVHRDMLGWLRVGRHGVVLLSQAQAQRLLAGVTLQAEDVDHGGELRRALMPPGPRIVVRASSKSQAAA